MKLIIAIVQDVDSGRLVSGLMDAGFSATKLATTGGFLRSGNTTLLIGVDDEKVDTVLEIIERLCSTRTQLTTMPPVHSEMQIAMPTQVAVGGATVFVLPVDQFIKL